MIPGYTYVSMLVTGGLHCFLGVTAAIIAIVGLGKGPYIRGPFVGALIAAIWVCFVGIIGIAAGVKKFANETTRKLKVAYTLTAILSACIVFGTAMIIYVSLYFQGLIDYYNNMHDYYIIGRFGIIIAILEFILAIVSSSICCCCSTKTENTIIISQVLSQQVVTTMPGQTTAQYQFPPNSTIYNQQPPNTVTQYQTSCDDTWSEQPPAYEQHAYPTKSQEET